MFNSKSFAGFVALCLLLFIGFVMYSYNFGVERKDETVLSCVPSGLSGEVEFSEELAFFEGSRIDIPTYAYDSQKSNVLGVTSEERWIEVDLSDQRLYAREGNNVYLETPVSTGLSWYPTPQGEFRIWIKLRATKMEGGSGRLYYYLPNVPYVMYFENKDVPGWRGYGLHGTYWHNDFGRPRSHGCVNLPTPIAEKLYYWTGPVLPEGKSMVRASDGNLGTRIIIHD